MQVSDVHNVKIYNLSSGRSLPDWLSDRKRRALLKGNVDIQRRIDLIQGFDMPDISESIRISRDGQYIIATGTYKPRVKCFDVNNLSVKFDRCFDADAVTFEVLSDDYKKLVFLQCDRYIEFHEGFGKHFRLRVPRYGRDMKVNRISADLLVVGDSPDMYRLNLQRGQFLPPFSSTISTSFNKCAINPEHQLIVTGSECGRIEAWDDRAPKVVGILDCALHCMIANNNKGIDGIPSITALKFNGALELCVGTATGQALLFDIRSKKPSVIHDHMYGHPIKNVDFHHNQDLMFSMDKAILKVWDKNNGKLFTSIESTADFNDFCVAPDSGLLFLTNESSKIQTYYIPALGPAPRWASFLDSLTEELEESTTETVYDDYKFVTKQELTNLGLDHLVGTKLLRAHMHGYFMDLRLYRKAKAIAQPFEFDDYRKRKIRETIANECPHRVHVDKLPMFNKDLALRLMNDTTNDINNTKKKKEKQTTATNLLQDDRFKALFDKAEFETDKNADEYRLLNPILSRMDKPKAKETRRRQLKVSEVFEPAEDEEIEDKNSSSSSANEDSSDDEHTWSREVKKEYRDIERERRAKERLEAEAEQNEDDDDGVMRKQPKLYELRQGEEFKGVAGAKRKLNKMSFGELLKMEDNSVKILNIGNREMKFSTQRKRTTKYDEMNKRHLEERRRLARPMTGIFKSKFRGGKRGRS